MTNQNIMALAVTSIMVGGCAGLDFGEQGLSYYEPKPYLFVSVNKECASTATVISLPGEHRHVKFKSGYGSSDLSVTLSNGILTNAGQKTDTNIPGTITSIASLGTAMATVMEAKSTKQVECKPSAILYPVVNGVPDSTSPVIFPVQTQTIGVGADR